MQQSRLRKLPTLLEGEALAVWIKLSAEQQDDIAQVKTALEKAMMPMNFVSLDDFHRRKLKTERSHHTLRTRVEETTDSCYSRYDYSIKGAFTAAPVPVRNS